MRFIVSPAKKMNVVDAAFDWRDLPRFADRAQQLACAVRALSYGEAKALWRCSDALAQLNVERFRTMDVRAEGSLTPAVLAYEGIQYQHLAAQVMTEEQLSYVQDHLRILSGLYGILRPLDGVVPYRLEMQAKLAVGSARNLYEFWGDSLYRALADETDVVVNLASVEYAKAVLPYARTASQKVAKAAAEAVAESASNPDALVSGAGSVSRSAADSRAVESGVPRIITCLFGSVGKDGRLVQRSTAAKAARGTMVRWCAERDVRSVDELRAFSELGYRFAPDRSDPSTLVFVQP